MPKSLATADVALQKRRVSTTMWALAASALLITLVAGGFYYYFQQCCLPHFRTVRRDVLYRSGQPRGLGLRALHLFGLHSSINLRRPEANGLQAEKLFDNKHGIGFHNIPIGNTPERIARSAKCFLAVMDDKANWPVLVHCSRGKERAGLFSAIFRMEYDHWSNQQALHEMYNLGLPPGSMPAVEEFVWSYQPRWRADAGDVPDGDVLTRKPADIIWQE